MRIAINGFGRIGRNILRSYLAREQVWKKFNQIEIVAINDLGSPSDNAHLLKYDSVHGKLKNEVKCSETSIKVDGHDIVCFSEREPSKLPWEKLNIDIVFECTGLFTSKDKAEQHIEAGAKKVLISAPGKNVDKTVVFGVNHKTLTKEDKIISNASCTTNCLAPLAKVIHEEYKILNGMANTIHAYTNDQSLLDVHHSDLLRARAASLSMIPTKTGAATAVGDVLPDAGVLGLVKNLIQKEPDAVLPPEDKEKALKLLEMDMVEMQEISKRWASDMQSDSWLSKNTRPLTLIFLTISMVLLVLLDSFEIAFEVDSGWVDLLKSLLITVYVAYFGSRGAEKFKSISK